MSNTAQKRQREKEMVSQMIALYCKKHHGGKGSLCPQCHALEEYARGRQVLLFTCHGREAAWREGRG